jgi:hypothetical protein
MLKNNNDNDSVHSTELSENEPENNINNEEDKVEIDENPEISNKKDNQKLVRTKSRKIKSACGQEIELQYRSEKPKKTKPIVVYYEDIVETPKPAKVVIKKKRGKGRPKKEQLIEYVNEEGEQVDDKMDASQTIINAPKDETYSKKDLEMIELQKKIMELEAVSGKKIRATKRGKVDGRQTKAPTEKQLEARKKFVEANKARHAKRKLDKEEENKLSNKQNVKEVIQELTEIKKQAIQKKTDEDELRNKILQEEKMKVEAEKKNNQFGRWGDDNLFK